MPASKTPSSKKRIVKDYENLPEEIIIRLKAEYPYGFANHLITYQNKEGKKVSALPYETDDIYYLIRMTVSEAREIIEADDDYDDDGTLRDDFSLGEELDNVASNEDEKEGDDED